MGYFLSKRTGYALLLSVILTASSAGADARPIVVVTLGTSLTLRGSWQHELADRLENCLARNVTVGVVAKAGANSDWGREAISQVAALQPDVVVIEFSINDARLWEGMSRDRARDNLVDMIKRLRHANPTIRVLLASMNPVVSWQKWFRPWLSHYYADQSIIAAEQRVEFVDIAGAWSKLPESELMAGIEDGLHPGPELARAVIAPALAEAIGGPGCIT